MANILRKTEAFDDTGQWTRFDSCDVTPNTHAAPSFAGNNAGLADTVTDPGGTPSSLYGAYNPHGSAIPDDASMWTASLYVRRDTNQLRFPKFGVQFTNGTGLNGGITINTETGATERRDDAIGFSSGVIAIDATWWRFWFTIANNATGNNAVRFYLEPAFSNTIDGGNDVGLTGAFIPWGCMLSNTPAITAYESDPAYSFHLPFFSQLTPSFR